MKKWLKGLLISLLTLSTVMASACSSDKDGDNSGGSADGEVGGAENVDPTLEEVKFTDTVLAENGRTDYKIVVPLNANSSVTYAANELKTYFDKSTGASIQIISDNGLVLSEGSKYISLGDTVLKSQAGVTVTKEEVNRDGFKMIRKDKTIIIAGFNKSGVIYGAYEFLHKTFGFEYYAMGEIALEEKSTAYLLDIAYTDAPSFEGRHIDGAVYGSADAMSKYRFKAGVNFDERYQTNGTEMWLGGWNCHSYFNLVPPYSNKDKTEGLRFDKPEWFGTGGQLCYTNDSLIDYIVNRIKELVAEQPDVEYINFGEEDFGGGFCQCTNAHLSFNGTTCKDTRLTYGVGGAQVRWINEIIKRVEAWRATAMPDKSWVYVTFAYQETMNAPVKKNSAGEWEAIDASIIPHEKLYIRYAPIERCFLHEYYDESCSVNKSYADNWNGWKAITDRFMVWDYAINFNRYLCYFDKFGTIKNEYKEYADSGVKNLIVQYTSGGNLGTFRDLTYYLNSKLMWNVNLNVNELIESFMNAYYKEAAPYMKQYLNLMRTHIATMDAEAKRDGKQFHMGMYDYTANYFKEASTWKKGVIDEGQRLIAQAYAVAEKMNPADKLVVKERILMEDVCLRYLLLRNYASYKLDTYSSVYSNMVDEWETDMRVLGVTVAGESGDGKLSNLLQVFRQSGAGAN